MPADDPTTIPAVLAARYPHTLEAFSAMGALDHLERIARLDAIWDVIRRGAHGAVAQEVYSVLPTPNPQQITT